MGHIDPGTGRNKRETGKLAKRGSSKGGQIRKSAGKPVERRIDQKRRNKTGR